MYLCAYVLCICVSSISPQLLEISLVKQFVPQPYPHELETLEKEAMIWSSNRNKARKTARWKFTKNDARRKLQKKYPMLQN